MKFLEKSNATFVSVLCVGPYGSNQGYCEPPMDASACVGDVIIAYSSRQKNRGGNEDVLDPRRSLYRSSCRVSVKI